MIPTTWGGKLVPQGRRRLCRGQGEQILGSLGAARQRQRGPYLAVFLPLAAYLGRAAADVARDLVAQILADHVAGSRDDAVRHGDPSRPQPPHDLVRHVRCDREVRSLHPTGRLDLERVGGAHVPIGRDLVAQALDEAALRCRERVGHNEQIRPDTTTAHDDPTMVGVEHQRGIDFRAVVPQLRGLGLRELVFFVLALALDGPAARREPTRRRELQRRLGRELPQRLHQSLPEGRRSDDHGAVVILQRAGDDLGCARRAPVGEHNHRKVRPRLNLPVVVLTNGGTASAAEIITGALQDHDRAVVVGTPTFGKGLVQSLWQLTPETALKLTTARWFTPSGRTIQRKSKSEEDQFAQAEAAELGRDSTKVDSTLVFHTDHSRTVLGGGGIRPDLFVAPDTFTTAERAFVKALGNKIPTYADVRTAYALEVKVSGRIKSPDFVVTPDMADEVIRRLRGRGVAVPDSVITGARNAITQDLGYEIARYVFGRPAEVRRQREEDRQVRAAVALARRDKSPQDLLALAAAQAPATSRN